MAVNPRLKKLITAANNGWHVTTPLYHWLTDQGDNSALVDINDPKMRALLLQLLSKRQHMERSGSFHSSELWDCERKQVFGYLGMPAKAKALTPETINLFNDGTWRHVRWQMKLMAAKIINKVEYAVKVPHYRFTGHIDGLKTSVRNPWWGLEVKGTSEFERVKLYGAFPEHIRQVHGYALGEPRIQEFVILYECKSTNHWHEVIVPIRPTVTKEIEGILSDLNEAVEHKKLPRILEDCKQGKGQYLRCPYAYACKQVDYAQAQAASHCSDAEEVIVTLNLKRRNTHQAQPSGGGAATPSVQDRAGFAVPVGNQGRTLRLSRGVTR